jgi:hypothetical protein
MPPRRRVEPPIANCIIELEMRELRARLEVMEAMQRREPNVGDISEVESEETKVEEAARGDAVEEHLLKSVVKLGDRAKIDIPMYEGNIDAEELLD